MNSERVREKKEMELISNRYLIEHRLNVKSANSYFLVSDKKNNDEKRCLKMIKFAANNMNELKEIMREESILSNLNHQYILKLCDSFIFSEKMCVVTEFCQDGDLAHYIKKMRKNNERLPEARILYWISQLLSACHYIHSRNILHRNIKPANIFLQNGSIKLGDFGIARSLNNTTDLSTFIGTPYYMSPELVKNELYSFKSDIWSVGCILFELATFQRPFLGETIFEIFDSIVKDEIPSITHLYSKELNKLLKRILVKSQKERPSAEELLCEPLIVNYVKQIVQKSIDSAKNPDQMAHLINSLASLSEILAEDAFGEYDERGTIRATSKKIINFANDNH